MGGGPAPRGPAARACLADARARGAARRRAPPPRERAGFAGSCFRSQLLSFWGGALEGFCLAGRPAGTRRRLPPSGGRRRPTLGARHLSFFAASVFLFQSLARPCGRPHTAEPSGRGDANNAVDTQPKYNFMRVCPLHRAARAPGAPLLPTAAPSFAARASGRLRRPHSLLLVPIRAAKERTTQSSTLPYKL